MCVWFHLKCVCVRVFMCGRVKPLCVMVGWCVGGEARVRVPSAGLVWKGLRGVCACGEFLQSYGIRAIRRALPRGSHDFKLGLHRIYRRT